MQYFRFGILLISGIFLLVGCQNKKEVKPNIVLIFADDLGYGELGCYGQKLIETPNLDSLARKGMRFTQFYTGSPVCAPSRCVLLTGLHTGHAFVRGNDEMAEKGDVWDYAKAVNDPNLEGQRPLPDSVFTMGDLLQNAGYKTAIVGKWGLGGPTSESIPNTQGFDFFYGYNCQRQAHNLYPMHLWKNKEKDLLDNELVRPGTMLDSAADPYDLKSYSKYIQHDYAPERMQDETLQFIERNKENPFFLYYATPLTHVPLQVPQEYIDYYVKKFGDEQPYTGGNGYFPNRYPHAAYAAMVSYLDSQVGEIVQKLKNLGIYENTLIMFTSDNGPTFNGGTDSPFFESGGPFRSERGWGKAFVHEGGIRAPFIAAWDGKIKPGTTSDLISATWDLMPTFAELSGGTIEGKTDGISLVPELLGEGDQPRHEFLYWEFPSYGGQQAVRMGNWKGIRKNLILLNDKDVKLFNLENDPAESTDVAGQNQEIVNQISRIMEEQHETPAIDKFLMPVLEE
ncbi:MAG: arylsulfatase [Bacteroidota bacterium]